MKGKKEKKKKDRLNDYCLKHQVTESFGFGPEGVKASIKSEFFSAKNDEDAEKTIKKKHSFILYGKLYKLRLVKKF